MCGFIKLAELDAIPRTVILLAKFALLKTLLGATLLPSRKSTSPFIFHKT
jgi:hypothetical protein